MTTTKSLGSLIDEMGVDVLDHLDRSLTVPVLDGVQAQGDVLVVPRRSGQTSRPTVDVPREGIPVVRGEAGGHTHRLLADGSVRWTPNPNAGPTDLALGTVTIPDGSVAYLAHEEHGYLGLAPGTFELRRQREQSDEIRLVSD